MENKQCKDYSLGRMPGKNLGSSPPKVSGREEARGRPPGRAAPSPHRPSRREPLRPSPHCLWASLRHDGTEPMKASPSPHCLTREHSSLSPLSRSPEHSPILPVFSPIFADFSDFLGRFRVIITRIHLHPRESGEDRHRIGEIHDDYLGKS